MSLIPLKVEDLNPEAFSPFGDVMDTEGKSISINQGTTERFHDLASIDVTENAGRPALSIFRAQPRPRPIAVKLMERHPLSSQAFFPLGNQPYLVLVAPVAEKPDARELKCFLARGNQGVNYRRNVWHHPLLAIDIETDFIVVDRDAEDENCDEYYFSDDLQISIDY